MKKSTILIFLLLIPFCVRSQIIRGTIYDNESGKPVIYATVYFEGTSIASNTDENGHFSIDTKDITNMPLTISALGYYSVSVADYSPQQNILVSLTPKVFELKEITIEDKGNPRVRRKNLEIFRREFLGRTKSTRYCRILNEDDLRFTAGAKNDTLRAYALHPLVIINDWLGYKITYYLEKFEFVRSEVLNHLIGSFTIVNDSSSQVDPLITGRRRDFEYYGSKLHFFRSLWLHSLYSEGFIVSQGNRELKEEDLVRYQVGLDPMKTRKYLYPPGNLPFLIKVIYEPYMNESTMVILKNNIYFNREGFCQGHNIIWTGDEAQLGIANLLPYDFKPGNEANKLFMPTLAPPAMTKSTGLVRKRK